MGFVVLLIILLLLIFSGFHFMDLKNKDKSDQKEKVDAIHFKKVQDNINSQNDIFQKF